LSAIDGKFMPWSQDANGRTEIPMAMEKSPDDPSIGYYVGQLSAEPPFALAVNMTYGIYQHGDGPAMLLKYYSNADLAVSPEDWKDLEIWGYTEFEVLLKPHLTRDRCFPPESPPESDSDSHSLLQRVSPSHLMQQKRSTTCFDVTVRFQGKPVGGTIKFFSGGGAHLGIAEANNETGVAAVEFPSDFGELYCEVKYSEVKSGDYMGTAYATIGHYATAFTRSDFCSSADCMSAVTT